MKETCRYCGSEIHAEIVWRDNFGELCPSERHKHLPAANPSPNAPDISKLLTDALYEIEALRAALRLVLIFHRGGAWTDDDVIHWLAITGTPEATTKVLCDHVRKVLK